MHAFVRSVLEKDGHQTLAASDGEAALEKADAGLPDLIILDVQMGIRKLRGRMATMCRLRPEQHERLKGGDSGGRPLPSHYNVGTRRW